MGAGKQQTDLQVYESSQPNKMHELHILTSKYLLSMTLG